LGAHTILDLSIFNILALEYSYNEFLNRYKNSNKYQELKKG